MKVIKKTYNLKSNIDTKVVLISDIHYYNKDDIKQLNKVAKKIQTINPKYICISGDLIDESNINDEEEFINWLNRLSNIAKVIISLGNHEFYINKYKKIYGLNEKLFNKIKAIKNLYLLDNQNKIIDNINFIGLTLPIKYYMTGEKDCFYKYLKHIKTYKKYYNVLLCHSPVDIVDKDILSKLDVNLILCGHMHGGITPKILRSILKNRGLVSPKLKLFPKVCYGHLKIKNTDIIITSGITVISHINKFRVLKKLFSSEIVEININKID